MASTSENNLLGLLHRWASRQDENFTTEAFAHLVKHLLTCEPATGTKLLNLLVGRDILDPEQAKAVEVKSQVSSALGRTDIEIRFPGAMIIIEVKDESGLTGDQLMRYRRDLDESGTRDTSLILLTRYPVETDAQTGEPHVKRRWYWLADRLNDLIGAKSLRPESRFLVQQFFDFLQERNMTMEQVGWELKAGVQSLMSLMKMLDEAIGAQKERRTISVTQQEYSGFSVREGHGWFGIYYDDPAKLFFHTYQIPIDASIAKELGGVIKERTKSWEYPNGLRWQLNLQLDSEEVHFFARSRASQMQEIEKFVKQGFDGLTKLVPK